MVEYNRVNGTIYLRLMCSNFADLSICVCCMEFSESDGSNFRWNTCTLKVLVITDRFDANACVMRTVRIERVFSCTFNWRTYAFFFS